jgi:hypothetical protein
MSGFAACRLIAGLMLALAVTLPASADDLTRMRAVDGLVVYLGVMPTETIRTHPVSYAEEHMHGGIPSGHNMYHVLVTVFDRATGERVSDAHVMARVAPLGLSGPRRTLDTMNGAGGVCYCNYFAMSGHERHRIDVVISRPDAPQPKRVTFLYQPE